MLFKSTVLLDSSSLSSSAVVSQTWNDFFPFWSGPCESCVWGLQSGIHLPCISSFKAGHAAVKWVVPAVVDWERRASKATKVMPILTAFLQGLAGMVLFWNLTDLCSFFSATLGKLSQEFPWDLCCICSHCILSLGTPPQASFYLENRVTVHCDYVVCVFWWKWK